MTFRNTLGQFNGEKRPLAERFWEKVNKTDDCWLWTGYLNKGYGYISINNVGNPAYRVSYQLHNGDIPDGLVVRHMCKSKACVNPKHLKLGTQKDNMEDAVKDGTTLKGEKNHRSKLKEEQVKDFIKNKPINNINDYILLKSKELNVSPTTLYDIHYRRTWKHL